MIGLAEALPAEVRTLFVLFDERGRARRVVERMTESGHETHVVGRTAGGAASQIREITAVLRSARIDVLCSHGYKANLLGLAAARIAGRPIIAVSRGWTAATRRVRAYELLDRLALRRMDRVVCVSEAQAARVRRTGVRDERVAVIRNAIQPERFATPAPERRAELEAYFDARPRHIAGAAGRLSPEKGFGVFVDAAAQLRAALPHVGFIHFGDGPLHAELQASIDRLDLRGRFVLAGHRDDLDALIPHLDLVVLPSYTEGLPNIALEAFAAKVPVVATAVGGTPEVVEHGVSGLLVASGDAAALAQSIATALRSEDRRREMGLSGYRRICEAFTFRAQARAYHALFCELARPRRSDARIAT